MYTLCCSAKLRERLRVTPAGRPEAVTTRLGDWYATPLKFDQEQVLAISVKTLLPVLVATRPEDTLPQRLASATGEVLRALGVPPAAVDDEVASMHDWACGQTTRRTVNRALTDFEWSLEARHAELGAAPLPELALWLAEAPCTAINWQAPDEATRALFGQSPKRHRFEADAAAGARRKATATAAGWSPSLSVGVEEIDRQHQELFAVFGELVEGLNAGRGPASVARLIDFLGRYVAEHFGAEERWMKSCDYPDFAPHKAEHEAFVADLKLLRERLRKEGPSQPLAVSLSGRIRSWLSFHIGGSDRAMGAYLQAHDVRTAP